MRTEEAEKNIGKVLRLILTNDFHYTGKVINSNTDTLIILDKYNKEVGIRLVDIMVYEVQNG